MACDPAHRVIAQGVQAEAALYALHVAGQDEGSDFGQSGGSGRLVGIFRVAVAAGPRHYQGGSRQKGRAGDVDVHNTLRCLIGNHMRRFPVPHAPGDAA